jgi:hypothetical protein
VGQPLSGPWRRACVELARLIGSPLVGAGNIPPGSGAIFCRTPCLTKMPQLKCSTVHPCTQELARAVRDDGQSALLPGSRYYIELAREASGRTGTAHLRDEPIAKLTLGQCAGLSVRKDRAAPAVDDGSWTRSWQPAKRHVTSLKRCPESSAVDCAIAESIWASRGRYR